MRDKREMNIFIRLLNLTVTKLNSAMVRERIANQVVRSGILNCGPNATVYNHGQRSNIKLGEGVILDGTLECYKEGELIIGDYSYIGRSRIFAAKSVTIGKGVYISDHIVVFDSDLHPLSGRGRYESLVDWNAGVPLNVYTNIDRKPVRIYDYVWIGANAVIIKGVTIGEGAVVGAGSVVTRDVPPYTIVAGNPARIIREIPLEER